MQSTCRIATPALCRPIRRKPPKRFATAHNAAFGFFGGVPKSILYDNTKLAVARILGDGTRQRTRVFSELQSHYLFADRFGRPGKGIDKGKVEVIPKDKSLVAPIFLGKADERISMTRVTKCVMGGIAASKTPVDLPLRLDDARRRPQLHGPTSVSIDLETEGGWGWPENQLMQRARWARPC